MADSRFFLYVAVSKLRRASEGARRATPAASLRMGSQVSRRVTRTQDLPPTTLSAAKTTVTSTIRNCHRVISPKPCSNFRLATHLSAQTCVAPKLIIKRRAVTISRHMQVFQLSLWLHIPDGDDGRNLFERLASRKPPVSSCWAINSLFAKEMLIQQCVANILKVANIQLQKIVYMLKTNT